jgi:hypothetical protein
VSSSQYARLATVRDLLLALWQQGEPFPPQVLRVEDGSWALPLASLKKTPTEAALADLCGRCRLQGQVIQTQPAGSWVPTWTALEGGWFNPRALVAADPERHAALTGRLGVRVYDPKDRGLALLLAAGDPDDADRLLQRLLRGLVQGIQAAPWVRADPKGDSPFGFFWHVSGEPLPSPVLQATARAWWGPIWAGSVQIWQQWPFALKISEQVLRRFTWGEGVTAVLLSREQPQVLELVEDPEAPDLEPLVNLHHVADLHAAERHEVEVRHPSDRVIQRFDVQLKLVETARRPDPRRRIRELRQGILAQEQALQELERRFATDPEPELIPEPLHLYVERPGRLPLPFRRLFLDWADQGDDLRNLYYQRIDGQALPEAGIPPEREVHILTTAAAVGKQSGMNMVGVRLRSYRPPGAYLPEFALAPDWVRYGLRLFIPTGQGLDLYPPVPPGPETARKLAQALLPPGGAVRQEDAGILLWERDGLTVAGTLHLSQFRPLLDVFDWHCVVEAAALPLNEVKGLQERAFDGLIGSVTQALAGSAEPLALTKLEAERRGWQTDLQARAAELATRQNELTAIDTQLGELRGLCQDAESALARVSELRTDIAKAADALRTDVQGQDELLTEIPSLQAQCRALEQDLQQLRERLRGAS